MGQAGSMPTPAAASMIRTLHPGRGRDPNETAEHYEERIYRHLHGQQEHAAALHDEQQQHAAEEQNRRAQGRHTMTFNGMPETPQHALTQSLTLNLHTLLPPTLPERPYDGWEAVDEGDGEAPLPEAFEEPREDGQSDAGDEGNHLEDNIEGDATDGIDRTLTSENPESRAAATSVPQGSRADQEIGDIVGNGNDLTGSIEGDATDATISTAVATGKAAITTKAAGSPTEEKQSSSIDKEDRLQGAVDGGATVVTDMPFSAGSAPSRASTTAPAPSAVPNQEQTNNSTEANSRGVVEERESVMYPADAPNNTRAREANKPARHIWDFQTGAEWLQFYNDCLAELRHIAKLRRDRKQETTTTKNNNETPLQKKQKDADAAQDTGSYVSNAPRRSDRLKKATPAETHGTTSFRPAEEAILVYGKSDAAAVSSPRRSARLNPMGERPQRSPPALPPASDDCDSEGLGAAERRAASGRLLRSVTARGNHAAGSAARRSTVVGLTTPVSCENADDAEQIGDTGASDEGSVSRDAIPTTEPDEPNNVFIVRSDNRGSFIYDNGEGIVVLQRPGATPPNVVIEQNSRIASKPHLSEDYDIAADAPRYRRSAAPSPEGEPADDRAASVRTRRSAVPTPES